MTSSLGYTREDMLNQSPDAKYLKNFPQLQNKVSNSPGGLVEYDSKTLKGGLFE